MSWYNLKCWYLVVFHWYGLQSTVFLISNMNPIPKVWASMRRQYHFWKLCRRNSWDRKILCPLGVLNLRPQHKITSDQLCLYKNCSFMGDLQVLWLYTSISLYTAFPLHNFQNWDCHCRWAYSFGKGEVWWMIFLYTSNLTSGEMCNVPIHLHIFEHLFLELLGALQCVWRCLQDQVFQQPP